MLILAVPEERASAALAQCLELEHHALRLGSSPEAPVPGTVWLRRPFDVRALAAFARRR